MEPKAEETQFNWSVDITLQSTSSNQKPNESVQQPLNLEAKYKHPILEPTHAKSRKKTLSLAPNVVPGNLHASAESVVPLKNQFEDLFRAQSFLARHGNITPPSPQYRYPPPGYRNPIFDLGYPSSKNGYPTAKYRFPNPIKGYPTSEYGYPNPKNGYPTSEYGYPNPKNGYPTSEYGFPNPKTGYPTSEYRIPNPKKGYPTSEYGFPNSKNGYPTFEYGFPNPKNGYPTSEDRYPGPKDSYTLPEYGFLTPEVILSEDKSELSCPVQNVSNDLGSSNIKPVTTKDRNQAQNLASRDAHPTPELVLIKEERDSSAIHSEASAPTDELSHSSDENSNGFQDQPSGENYPTPELVLIKEESDLALEDENEEDSDDLEQEASEEGSDSCNLERRQDSEYNVGNSDGPDMNSTINSSLQDWKWCQKCLNYFHRNDSEHSCNQPNPAVGKPKKSKKLKPYPCTHCVRKFARVDQLVKHLKKRLGVCPYICPICCAYFGDHTDFSNHDCKKTSERKEEETFKCWDCGKVFSGKNYLSKHQKRHLAVKRYKCATCGKMFAEKYHLSRHQVTHSNVKELTCNECGKSFSLRNNLIVHQRIHLGIKPYKCSHCGRSFFQNVNRLAHELTHTGERPYKCVCRAEYSSRYLLNKHSKTCKKVAKLNAKEAKNGTKQVKSDEGDSKRGKDKKIKVEGKTEKVKDKSGETEVNDDVVVVEEGKCDPELVKDDSVAIVDDVKLISETEDTTQKL